MDLATLVGVLGALGIILSAIMLGGDPIMFLNIPSILIVVCGTLFAVLIKFSLSQFLGSFKVAGQAFFNRTDDQAKLIEEGVMLANIARKEGVLGLEGQEISNEFLQRGIGFCVDGHEPEFVQRMLSKDINLTIERHELGKSIFKSIGDMAPAMGMIGTLIGLVQMLASMDDPKTIGPSMAVALLTTLYGAVIANAFALPIADKLANRSQEERLNKALILETISSIQEGLNPRVLEELLKTFLPSNKRDSIGAEEDAA